MTIPEIINSIHLLAEEHRSAGNDIDDLKDTDWLESKGFQLIIDYCMNAGMLVNGFPVNIDDGFLGDEEVTDEHWQLYIDHLTIVHTDVALLHFEWAHAFWPGDFKNQEELVESVQARLTGSFYDVTL
ncbi:MAG: hypothetical protein IM577_02640 [Chitinophagaceae bacterium]|nr:hypothetical protein [Chitinophagaceae bacterium]